MHAQQSCSSSAAILLPTLLYLRLGDRMGGVSNAPLSNAPLVSYATIIAQHRWGCETSNRTNWTRLAELVTFYQWCSRGGTRGTPLPQIFLWGENAVPPNNIKTRGNGDIVAFHHIGHQMSDFKARFDFGWGSAPDPTWQHTALPRPPSWT